MPATLLVSVTELVPPEHSEEEAGETVKVGIGFAVTVTTIGVPAQLFAVGVMVYVAVPGEPPVAVSACAITVPEPADAPDTPLCDTVHEKVVPLTLLDKVTVEVDPEHSPCDDGVAVAEGNGFTVTVAVFTAPGQLFAVGVIVYTAVPAVAVLAVNAWEIVDPDPLEAPVTFVCVTVHEYVVPVTLLLKARVVDPAEQMVCAVGETVAVGIGLTVTVTTIGEPVQAPSFGVMVYVAVPVVVPVVVNVCVIVDPDPVVAPVTPVCETVHEYVVVPELLLSEKDVALPEQIV